MVHSITLTLTEGATAAFLALRNEGIDPETVVEEALVRRAAHLRERAEEAARLRADALQRTGLDDVRTLPPQIEHIRPPR